MLRITQQWKGVAKAPHGRADARLDLSPYSLALGGTE
jgi:hypothetical protein